jgi:hypothetical protein
VTAKIQSHGTIVAVSALLILYEPHISGKCVRYKLLINCIKPLIKRKIHIHDVPGNLN